MSIFSSDSVSVTTVYQAVGENNGPAHLGESKEASPAWRLYPGNETITWDGAALVNLGASNAETVVVLKNVAGEILESVELDGALPGQKQLLFLTGLFTPPEDGSYYEIRSNQPWLSLPCAAHGMGISYGKIIRNLFPKDVFHVVILICTSGR